jgi:hypothetical protein
MSELRAMNELLKWRSLQLIAFAALMTALGITCFITKYSVLDPDVWWHLKVGDWIVQKHAVPHRGIFSNTAADRPWVAYSWGYEVLLSRAYGWFGLIGMGWFGVLLTLAVAGILFWVLYRLARRFWRAWILTIVGCIAFLFSIMPRPVFFSMMLFAIVLMLILETQRSCQVHRLYWLPLIFAVWANLHIQFIYGLATVALFFAIIVFQHAASALKIDYTGPPTVPLLPLSGITAACFLAACIGPYSFHLYQVVLEYSKAKATYSLILELQPLRFSSIHDYLELSLAAAGFFAVGWQRRLDPFKVALMVFASMAAFRTMRDGWFVCIPALAFMADFPAESESTCQSRNRLQHAGVAIAIGLLLLLAARNADFNTLGLDRAISSSYPVDAANFIRRSRFGGPLYNSFDWGGFLIWYMPQYPVAIDGRNDLYGDELDSLFITSQDADSSQDPFLKAAGLVLIKRDVSLATALALDRNFQLVYKDPLSVVFVRKSP